MGTPDDADYSYQNFENLELIGSGGNADVFKSQIEVDGENQLVALKTPRMSEYETVDTGFFDDFIREAELWARIDDHKHIVSVFDWGPEPYPWIALEYVEAGNLSAIPESFSLTQRAEIFEQICNGVFHAHRHGITHSDLKPANILLSRDSSEELIAKIGDWGLANLLLEHSQKMDQMTLAYSAPEQVDSTKHGSVDDRTDIYQLGMVAYELFAGSSPFESGQAATKINKILNSTPPKPSKFNKEIPPTLDDAILQSLSKNKDERYETVTHLRDAVTTAVNDAKSNKNPIQSSDQQVTTQARIEHSDTNKDEFSPSTGTTSSSTSTATNKKEQTGDTQSLKVTPPTQNTNSTTTSTTDSTRTPSSPTRSDTTSNKRRRQHPSNDTSSDKSSNGLFNRVWGFFQKPAVEIDYRQRGMFSDIRFSFAYARTSDTSTLKRGMGVFLLTLIYGIGSPIMLGHALDVIQTTAKEKKEYPSFRWLQNTKHGIILIGSLTVSLILAVMPVEFSESLGALGLLLWMFLLPAIIINYGVTRRLRSAFGWRTVRIAFSLRYIGMIIGAYIVLIIGYLVTALSFLTIIGGFAAGFLSITALAAYAGRRYSGYSFA